MAPSVGDTVFVTEVDNLTEETTVSPAMVTHVFDKDDGPADWWKVAQSREIVQAQVFRRNGTSDSVTVGKIDDDNPTGYSSSVDGAASADTSTVQTTPQAGTPRTDATPADGGLGSIGQGGPAERSGTATDTVGDGSGAGGTAGTDTGTPAP